MSLALIILDKAARWTKTERTRLEELLKTAGFKTPFQILKPEK